MLFKSRLGMLIIIIFTIAVMLTGCARQSDGQAPTSAIPQAQEKQLRLLDSSGKALYTYTKDGKYEEARIELDRFSDLITTISYKGITSLEGVNALTQTVTNARRIFNKLEPSEKDVLTAATQLRLITDALTHPNRPIWLEYETLLLQDVARLHSMVKSHNDVGSLAALQSLHYHYSIIHPAIIVTREASIVEKIDSLFNFLTMELSQGKVDYTRVNQGVNHLPAVLNELFGSKDSQTFVPLMIQSNNVIWTTFVASVIISSLAYVAWRRYKVL